jgi:TPR repeat protein
MSDSITVYWLCVFVEGAVIVGFLAPAHGSAQDSVSVSCVEVTFPSPLEDLTHCAEQGHARAQYLLGLRYKIGHDAPQDDAEAFLWYRLAAEQGHASAQSDLGYQYAKEGFLQNLVYAYLWLDLSAAQGNEAAGSNKDMLEERMTRQQISEAQRLSREWIEAHPQDGGN